MTQKYRVLWVEDGARYDLAHLAAPVYMDGKYDLVIAEDASAGMAVVLMDRFDVIIVDIRIPPGDEPNWIKLYQGNGTEKIAARLGLSLLYTFLGHPDAKIDLGSRRPAWITPARVGVLTVESQLELHDDLTKLGITIHGHKRAETSDEILLELIQRVLDQANHLSGGG
jgi:hypothetical protein